MAASSGGPDQKLDQSCFVRLVLFHVQVHDILAFRGVNVVNGLRQLQGLLLLQGRLSGVDFFACLQACCRKKLLRFAARLSARAMIAPIDLRHVVPPV